MKKNWLWLIGLAALLLLPPGCAKKTSPAGSAVPIRIGWQNAWATQGQLAEILQRTNILSLFGLTGDFKAFDYGAPLSEAAIAGQLDACFLGDQPAINLLSRSPNWEIAARLMDCRVAIIVPPVSPVKTVADLKGKTMAIPFGSSAHRGALEMLKEGGLDPAKDVKFLNIDITEQGEIVKAAGGKKWPGVDAFASWDPHIAFAEQNKLAGVLAEDKVLGVVMMSAKFVDAHPQAAAGFLAAFKLAYYYYATHQEQADQWFLEVAPGNFSPALLDQVAEIEPNLKADSLDKIDIAINKDIQLPILQSAAEFAFRQNLIKQEISIIPGLDRNLLTRGEAILAAKSALSQEIKVNR